MNLSLRIAYLFGCLMLSVFALIGQNKYTISGYVQDAETGEKLINAKVYDKLSLQGTISNSFGFYSLTLSEGPVSLVAAYAGYEAFSLELDLRQNAEMLFELGYFETDEVEIVAENQIRIQESTEMSTIDVPIKQIKLLPALLGEVDVIKAIQLLPGVQSGSEGTTGLYVRGGGPDQNLILLDDVPLYYVSHLGGFFSVFNADALSNVKLIKGGFPARYGGRLSSVLDIRMKEGNLEKYQVEGSIGLISSKLSVQGPLISNKTSFMVSARRTYLDLFTRPLSQLASRAGSEGNTSLSFGYYFYDLNGKINHIFSSKDRLYLSFYLGDDNLGFSLKDQFDEPGDPNYNETSLKSSVRWGNRMVALRWNHIWNPKLFSNTTATYTNYRFRVDNDLFTAFTDNNDIFKTEAFLGYRSGIEDWGGKIDFDYYPNPNHDIKFGALITHHDFTPGLLGFAVSVGDSSLLDTTFSPEQTQGLEGGLYVEDRLTIGNQFSANIGLRASFYAVGEETYWRIEPRASARFLISDRASLKGSFVIMNQYLHLLTNSGSGLPVDLWVPATDRVPPQQSWQAAFGGAASLGSKGEYEFSAEAYFKRMTNLIEYKEGTNFFVSFEDRWEDRVETGGEGWAYGLELLLQKKLGKTTGWVGYTLSWNNRQFDNINQGELYPYKFDRRHDASIVVAREISKQVSLSATWVFGTGNAITLPSGGYSSLPSDPFFPSNQAGSFLFQQVGGGGLFGGGGGVQLYENGRNNFRMAPYHRMDIGFNFTKQKKWGERTWSLGVYNVYASNNPYTYFVGERFDDITGDSETVLRKISLFPIPIPFISYNFRFEKAKAIR